MNKEIIYLMTTNTCYSHIRKICDSIDELQLSEERERQIFDTELLTVKIET